MKNLILITMICFGLFILGACEPAAENTNTPENTNAKANKEEPKEEAKLKPENVKLDEPVVIKDLVTSAAADKDAWKDKEVAVKGVVFGVSGSGGKFGYVLTLKSDKDANTSDNLLSCKVPEGDQPKDIMSKTITAKGKIANIKDEGIMIGLDPCEISMDGEKSEDKEDSNSSEKDEDGSSEKKDEAPDTNQES